MGLEKTERTTTDPVEGFDSQSNGIERIDRVDRRVYPALLKGWIEEGIRWKKGSKQTQKGRRRAQIERTQGRDEHRKDQIRRRRVVRRRKDK